MKITLAQIRCVAGDIDGNVKKIVEAAHKAKASTLVIFPELSVSGCDCGDRFGDPVFIKQCEKALEIIASECETVGVLVGCPVGKFNAAVYMFQGQRKVFKKKQLTEAEKKYFV
ncbi:MAG: NAD+ synthase, partial [Bacteroidales bacterium]|nr:NAD+ synthase [Bacteroidales bacterium]